MHGDAFDEIVSLLYEAVLDDGVWPRLYRDLGAAAGVDAAHLAIVDGASADPDLIFSQFQIDGQAAPDIEARYIRDFFAIDERIPRLNGLPTARLVHNRELFSDREKRNSATYNEFLRPLNSINQVLVSLPGPDRPGLDLWVLSRYRSRDWDAEETALIDGLVPHMARFLRLRRALARAQAADRSLAGLLDDVRAGAILLDRRGRVAECNVRARAILNAGDMLIVDDGDLRAVNGQNGALGRALSRALPGPAPAGGSIVLKRAVAEGLQGHLTVHVVPVTAEQPDFGAERIAVLLILIDPWMPPALDAPRVGEALGLSESEAQVACLLAQGQTVHEIARLSQRTRHTVRFHLKQTFAKTGVHRQADLVRLVLAAGVK